MSPSRGESGILDFDVEAMVAYETRLDEISFLFVAPRRVTLFVAQRRVTQACCVST